MKGKRREGRFSTETCSKRDEAHVGTEAAGETIMMHHLSALRFMAKGCQHHHACLLLWFGFSLCIHMWVHAVRVDSVKLSSVVKGKDM